MVINRLQVGWLAIGLLGLMQLGARLPEDEFVAGYRAYQQEDYDTALRHFHAALIHSPDPGLVAYHQGVVLAAAGRHAEAAAAWARTLEDAQGLRRWRAAYGQATALTRVASTLHGRRAVRLLQQSLQLFDQVRQEAAEAKETLEEAQTLVANAQHNRAVAEALLAQKLKEPEPLEPPDQDITSDSIDNPRNQTDPGAGNRTLQPGVPRRGTGNPGGAGDNGKNTNHPGKGDLPLRTGDDQMPPMSPDEANRRLDEVLRRLQRPLHGTTPRPGAKDW
jgi:tetratricopeptide (TPR) repeat protein